MSYCDAHYGCSTSACTAGCGSGCAGGCRQISSGSCNCSGFCTGGCYNGCANTCQGCSSCGSGCASGCSGCGSGCASGCTGCGSGCSSSCSGCGSGCSSGCTGCGSGCENNCSGCGSGCSSSCSGCGSGCSSGCSGCGSGCSSGCSGCGSGCASSSSGGSSGDLSWKNLGSGSSSTSVSFSLSSEVGFYSFTASTSGTLTVYTTGSSDTVGWLTDGGCRLSDASGNSILTGGTKYIYDDDGGTDSNFRYSIAISAGQYEIDVAQYGAGSCRGTLHIQWASSSGGGSDDSMNWKKLGSGNSTTTVSFDLSANYVGFYSYTAPASGTLTVYTESSYDTVGWLTDGKCSLSKASGNSILTGGTKHIYDDDSGTGSNFKYTYNVTSGVKYEIDVAQFRASACSGTLYIEGPASGWQTPRQLYIIGSAVTSTSGTHSCAADRAGFFKFTTPSRAGKMVFQTTSGATSSDYYSYLSNTVLNGNSSSTSRTSSVTGTILTKDDDGGAAGYDTLISYIATANTDYYWYVNAAYGTGTLSIPWSFNYYRQFTWTFNANGGSGAPAAISSYEDSPTATIPSTQPTRTNYTFLGWSTSSTATSPTYYANDSVNITSDVTLYAVWKSNSKTITYNANGGSGAPAAQTFTSSTATISTTRPTYTDKVFKGWSTSSSSLTPTYLPGVSYSFSSNVTLYAVWWPQFTWVTETATQARVLVSYIATYMNETAPNVYAGDTYMDDWYNEIAQILSMTYNVSLGQILTKADMQKLADAWNTPA